MHRRWAGMVQRCTNPKHQAWKNYGGRGITVCPEWMEFSAFLRDMGEPPKGCTLERVDNDLGYSADNCRWATRKEQARNRRDNRRLTFQNQTKCLVEWAETTGMSAGALTSRLDKGWPLERALTEEIDPKHKKDSLMQRVNYHLPESTIKALKKLSEKTGLTVAEIIRRAIDAYLERKS